MKVGLRIETSSAGSFIIPRLRYKSGTADHFMPKTNADLQTDLG
jgi:hypothetical protein